MKAFALKCTLKPRPDESSTDVLLDQLRPSWTGWT